MGQIQKFEETSDAHAGGASGGLAAQISDLRKSVPEIHGVSGRRQRRRRRRRTSQRARCHAPQPTRAETFRPESAGIIALFGKWFSLESARRDLADATKQTDGMTKDLGKIRDAVVQQIRTLSNQNLEATSNDPAALAQSRLKFQQAAARFKQLVHAHRSVGRAGRYTGDGAQPAGRVARLPRGPHGHRGALPAAATRIPAGLRGGRVDHFRGLAPRDVPLSCGCPPPPTVSVAAAGRRRDWR